LNMFLQKHAKTTPTYTKEGLWRKHSFFRTSTVGCGMILT
jgi:hypothetical protein